MRELYKNICKIVVDAIPFLDELDGREAMAALLINLNRADAPLLDQDICDFLSDTYMFVVWGYDTQAYPEGIRDLKHLQDRLQNLLIN